MIDDVGDQNVNVVNKKCTCMLTGVKILGSGFFAVLDPA
jgi:hypothetical protein